MVRPYDSPTVERRLDSSMSYRTMPQYIDAGSVGHLFGTFSIGCLLSRTEHAQSL